MLYSTIAAVFASTVIGFCTTEAFTSKSSSSFRNAASSLNRKTFLSMSSALIVQNKGGGHGELGFQLAKVLEKNSKITSITILQDDACDDTKEPFKSYANDIPNVKVLKATLGDADKCTTEAIESILGNESYDYIWDNASKKPEGIGKTICDLAKSKWNSKLYTYVSSAGMYVPDETNPIFPMPETTPAKESSGQKQFEQYMSSIGLPFVSFRPQYIYGPKSNKYDYIDWYFDRLVRKLPLPIPSDGSQKVSLTNAQDVASLLASVLNDETAATSQAYFNCGTDNLLSYDEVAFLCAEAAGIKKEDVAIDHYDAQKLGKGKFPFRLTDFYVAPDLAKEKLAWGGPKSSLKGDLKDYYDGYVTRGGPTKDFKKDEF